MPVNKNISAEMSRQSMAYAATILSQRLEAMMRIAALFPLSEGRPDANVLTHDAQLFALAHGNIQQFNFEIACLNDAVHTMNAAIIAYTKQ